VIRIKINLATKKGLSIAFILSLTLVSVAYASYSIFSPNIVTDTVSEYTLGPLISNSTGGLQYSAVTFSGQLLPEGLTNNQTVQLLRSGDMVTFDKVAETQTDALGYFEITINRTDVGTWYYKSEYVVE